MGTYLALYLIFLSTPGIITECDIGGTWSTWKLTPNQTSYDYCGSCWKANFIRQCLSETDCPCDGPIEFTGEMNIGVCISPRTSCCPGYENATYNGIQACLNSTTLSIDTPPGADSSLLNDSYCPSSGVGIWGSWSEWGDCSAPCGQFGTKNRTRECISETYGCTCCKSDAGLCQTMPCPDTPCPDEPKCSGALFSTYDNYVKYCYPFGKTPPTGSWSEWAAASDTVCNATCGMKGLVNSTRGCFPSGSVCSGTEYWSMQPCPSTICVYPGYSCNPGFKIGRGAHLFRPELNQEKSHSLSILSTGRRSSFVIAMAEETLVKMVDNDGQTEEKIIKTSHTLTRTVEFPSKKEWKLADDEIVMSGEVFAGFFILEELDEPFTEVEDVATITKEGFLVVYESDCRGYMINLRQVKSVSMAGMPFSESSGKWFELMYVGICLLVEFGKIIIIAEKARSSQWIQALGQFVPCDIEETVLFTLDGTDTEEEEEQEDELETTGTEEEAEETDREEESQSESQSEQTEKTLPSVSGHHTELETISEDEEEEEKDAILKSSGQSSATHNTM